MRVDVLVLQGSLASSVAITLDTLATANRLRVLGGRRPAFQVKLVGSGARSAKALAGDLLDHEAPGDAKLIIMPGLGMMSEAHIKTRLAEADAIKAMRLLQAAIARGAEVATSCSGAFLLAQAGLLTGRKATTTWWLAPVFRKMHPQITLETDALVLQDGPVTTAGAAMAQMDLMLSLIARQGSSHLAAQCARYLLLDQRGSQTRYMALGFLASGDAQIAKAEKWAKGRLEKGFKIDDLAAAAGLSSRTFARRMHQKMGMSPIQFVQRMRVEAAQEMLETTKLAFDDVAQRVGYSEPSTLRRILRRDNSFPVQTPMASIDR